jgi:hypothetical protein
MLKTLCKALGINFDPAMLNWRKGPRDSDGVWAKHWYESVWNSTGFAPYREKPLQLAEPEQEIADLARPYYQQLYQHRIQVPVSRISPEICNQ